MNATRDLGPDFRSWLSDVPPTPPELLQRTLDETRQTRQRRRWLWFLPGPKPTAGVDGWHDGVPLPASTTSNHIGGTRSMFSATKLLAVAASVALFGALTVALPLGQQQDATTPGAEVPTLGEITPYTGEMEVLGKDQIGTRQEFDWGFGRSGEQWTTRLTTDDPRYSGLVTGIHNSHQLESGGAFLVTHTSRMFTEDEGGTWLQTGYGYQDPEATRVTYVTQSTGEGIYEGWSAFDVCEQTAGANGLVCRGIIFKGDWPEFAGEAPPSIPELHLDA